MTPRVTSTPGRAGSAVGGPWRRQACGPAFNAGRCPARPQVIAAARADVSFGLPLRPGCGAGAPVPAGRQAEVHAGGRRNVGVPYGSAGERCRTGAGRLIAGVRSAAVDWCAGASPCGTVLRAKGVPPAPCAGADRIRVAPRGRTGRFGRSSRLHGGSGRGGSRRARQDASAAAARKWSCWPGGSRRARQDEDDAPRSLPRPVILRGGGRTGRGQMIRKSGRMDPAAGGRLPRPAAIGRRTATRPASPPGRRPRPARGGEGDRDHAGARQR